MSTRTVTHGAKETLDLGRRLAQCLLPGDIVLLDGPLGAGKTVLVRGVVSGLDPSAAALVTSQSYVIVGTYPTTPRVNHIDLYRLGRVEDVIGLGYEELLYGSDSIALVEWPAILEPLLEPDDPVLRLSLAHGAEAEERVITVGASDARLERVFEASSAGVTRSAGLRNSGTDPSM